jgi:nucleoside-diphosphate-sugar epimerase
LYNQKNAFFGLLYMYVEIRQIDVERASFMRCRITGVAGFIGSHLAERLLVEGHEVWGIDSFVEYYPRAIKERNLEGARSWERFTFFERDLLDPASGLHTLLDGMEWVFHLAAQAGVRASWGRDFARYIDNNIVATQRLLEALATSQSLRRFVYASSSSIYGEHGCSPLTEDTLPRPHSPYGVSKLAAEHLCLTYHRNFDLPVVLLRYFSVYGPRQRPDMALHRFCKAIVKDEPLSIFGDGGQSRDFTFVSDIVEASVRAATSEQAIGKALNIAGGTHTTLCEVLDLLREINGGPLTITHEQARPGDVHDTLADTSRAAGLLGYTPRVALSDGLARQFASILDLYAHRTG